LFKKFAKIFAAQGATPVSLTPVTNGKNLQLERFSSNLLPVPLTPVANMPLESTTPAVMVAKFAPGVVDTGGAP
jgi:hypothetical protein